MHRGGQGFRQLEGDEFLEQFRADHRNLPVHRFISGSHPVVEEALYSFFDSLVGGVPYVIDRP